jgi:hypothetical protein
MRAMLVSFFDHRHLLRQVLAFHRSSNSVADRESYAPLAMQRFAVIGLPEEILIWNYWPIGH